ncbi:hypothetical protein L873DRAFT_1707236 [Choiromyces venosus 120613-1]|uniref:Uncharacterized protein n=1 Tax=Choiromyces venosus 120613-1 TaxID=1336337 RepID=A0A3N4J9E8_9PEZI|nr:hypothetical protein L873DRAFT_1707236 [Choiromyces venosus 120613-1]
MAGHGRKPSSSSLSSSSYTCPSSDRVGDGNRRTNSRRSSSRRGGEDGRIKGVEFSVQFNLKHSNAPGISRAHAPDLRIEIPTMGDGGVGGGLGGGGSSSIISSAVPSSASANSSSISLNSTSEHTLTITEYHTYNTMPKKIPSCIAIHSLNKAILRQKKSFSNTILGIKSGFKARFRKGGKHDSHDEEDLQKICYSLINLPEEEISTRRATRSENLNCTVFKRQSLTLTVKALGSKQFELILPSIPETMTSGGLESVLAGDAEEQGHGGSFERFLSMLPESCRDISEKASPLGLVPKLLPYGEISVNARYIGSCFWMWLCIIDDLTETLTGEAWDKAESDLLRTFEEEEEDTKGTVFSPSPSGTTTPQPPPPTDITSDIVKVSKALRTVINETTLYETPANGSSASPHSNTTDDNLWRPIFRKAVHEVIMGFRAERPLIGSNGSSKIDLTDWMRVRIITISVRPFMILARASLGLDPTLSPFGNPLAEDYQDLLLTSKKSNRNNLAKVECLLQLIMGLQNDIIGWEKDHKTKTPLNTIQILIKEGKKPTKALAQVITMHNELVEHLAKYGDCVWSETFVLPPMTPLPYHNPHLHANGSAASVAPGIGSLGFAAQAQVPPVSSGSGSVTIGSLGGGGGGGGPRVFGNHFCTSTSSSSVASSLNTGGGGGSKGGDYRDSLLSTTRRPETACSAQASAASNENLRKYLELAVGFSAGMANWMVDSRRYVV